MLKLATVARRMAVFLDHCHWVLLILAAPFLLFPAPGRAWALAIVPGVWLIAWLAGHEPLPRTPLNSVMLLLALMVLVSLYATYDIAISLPKIAGMVLGLGVFFALVRAGRSTRGWWIGLTVFVGIGLGIAGLGLLGSRWITKVGFLTPVISRLPSALIRLPGASEGLHPNEVAGALLWVLPPLVGFLWCSLPRMQRWQAKLGWCLMVGTTLVMAGVFVLTQSRSGYIALAFTGLVMVVIAVPGRVRRWAAVLILIVAIAVGGIVARIGVDAALHSVLGRQSAADPALSLDTLEGRVEVWSRALYAIQDFPFTGMGMNTFRHVVHVLYPLFLVGPDFDLAHAHNEFLQAALDLGLPGLIAFLALYIGAFWMLWKIWQFASPSTPNPSPSSLFPLPSSFYPLPSILRPLVLGLGGGLLAHLIYGLTDAVALGAKPGLLFWMLLGLIAGLYEQAQAGTATVPAQHGSG